MTEEEKQVAQELANHPNFRPMVGMKFLSEEAGYPLICTSWSKNTHTGECTIAQEGDYYTLGSECYPDISHPATKGCLLALARELHGIHFSLSASAGGRWSSPTYGIIASTEGIALARAIMEAPTK